MSAPGGSHNTVNLPTAVETVATNTQVLPLRRQGGRPTPRRRGSQLPSSPEAADSVSKQDPIAESAAKDDKRLTKRLIKLMEELDDTVQSAERGFDLAHNAQCGTIRMPGDSHDQHIHQAVRGLLMGSNSVVLRHFQENSVKMNQIITVNRVLNQQHVLIYHSANTRRE